MSKTPLIMVVINQDRCSFVKTLARIGHLARREQSRAQAQFIHNQARLNDEPEMGIETTFLNGPNYSKLSHVLDYGHGRLISICVNGQRQPRLLLRLQMAGLK